MSPDAWKKIETLGTETHFEKKTRVFSDGDPYAGPYLVRAGLFNVFNCTEDGRETVLHIFEPGQWIATAPLFTEASAYHSCCSCIQKGSALFFPEATLLARLKKDAEICYALAAATMRYAVTLKDKLVDLTLASARDRVLKYFESISMDDGTVRLALPKHQVAATLHISAEMFSRSLRLLKEENRILEEDGLFRLLP